MEPAEGHRGTPMVGRLQRPAPPWSDGNSATARQKRCCAPVFCPQQTGPSYAAWAHSCPRYPRCPTVPRLWDTHHGTAYLCSNSQLAPPRLHLRVRRQHRLEDIRARMSWRQLRTARKEIWCRVLECAQGPLSEHSIRCEVPRLLEVHYCFFERLRHLRR